MTFIQKLTEGWTFLRALRLIIGSLVLYNGIVDVDYPFIFIGGILLYQSLLNTGCGMGNSSCEIESKPKKKDDGLS